MSDNTLIALFAFIMAGCPILAMCIIEIANNKICTEAAAKGYELENCGHVNDTNVVE